jgi:penicillin-binding protein 1A
MEELEERLEIARAERDQLLATGSIVIQTTIDLEIQIEARAVLASFLGPEEGPQGGIIVLDRQSAAVLAVVASDGGTRPLTMEALLGRGRRTGSALKPIALGAALDAGMTLDTEFPAPECIALPDNAAEQTCGGRGGLESLLDATAQSLNPVFVQLVDQVGVEAFGLVAAELGIASGSEFSRTDAVLGTYPVSIREMSGAYRAISAGGEYIEPVAIDTVTGAGDVLALVPAETTSVLSPGVWEDVDTALRMVVEDGTGRAADLDQPSAGKTGTAIGITDAWFVGYTDDIVAAVWIGFADEPERPMVMPATPITVTGGSWPAVMWAQLVSGVR